MKSTMNKNVKTMSSKWSRSVKEGVLKGSHAVSRLRMHQLSKGVLNKTSIGRPMRRHLRTLNRAPHGNKTARDQFVHEHSNYVAQADRVSTTQRTRRLKVTRLERKRRKLTDRPRRQRQINEKQGLNWK